MSCFDQLADNHNDEKAELGELQNQILELRSAKIDLLQRLEAQSPDAKPREMSIHGNSEGSQGRLL